MLSRASVLVYGSDHPLLETRRWMLEREGARVWAATKLADFGLVAPDESIDLIILCYSLSTEQCNGALALAHTLWPQAQILALSLGVSGYHPGSPVQAGDVSMGPAYLVQTVARLLGTDHRNELSR